jgi:hypothetical protein
LERQKSQRRDGGAFQWLHKSTRLAPTLLPYRALVAGAAIHGHTPQTAEINEKLLQATSLLLDHRHFAVVTQDTLAGEFCVGDLADELPYAPKHGVSNH